MLQAAYLFVGFVVDSNYIPLHTEDFLRIAAILCMPIYIFIIRRRFNSRARNGLGGVELVQ